MTWFSFGISMLQLIQTFQSWILTSQMHTVGARYYSSIWYSCKVSICNANKYEQQSIVDSVFARYILRQLRKRTTTRAFSLLYTHKSL